MELIVILLAVVGLGTSILGPRFYRKMQTLQASQDEEFSLKDAYTLQGAAKDIGFRFAILPSLEGFVFHAHSGPNIWEVTISPLMEDKPKRDKPHVKLHISVDTQNHIPANLSLGLESLTTETGAWGGWGGWEKGWEFFLSKDAPFFDHLREIKSLRIHNGRIILEHVKLPNTTYILLRALSNAIQIVSHLRRELRKEQLQPLLLKQAKTYLPLAEPPPETAIYCFLMALSIAPEDPQVYAIFEQLLAHLPTSPKDRQSLLERIASVSKEPLTEHLIQLALQDSDTAIRLWATQRTRTEDPQELLAFLHHPKASVETQSKALHLLATRHSHIITPSFLQELYARAKDIRLLRAVFQEHMALALQHRADHPQRSIYGVLCATLEKLIESLPRGEIITLTQDWDWLNISSNAPTQSALWLSPCLQEMIRNHLQDSTTLALFAPLARINEPGTEAFFLSLREVHPSLPLEVIRALGLCGTGNAIEPLFALRDRNYNNPEFTEQIDRTVKRIQGRLVQGAQGGLSLPNTEEFRGELSLSQEGGEMAIVEIYEVSEEKAEKAEKESKGKQG